MEHSGLVLAGGGARGAYEVGVLYYLFVHADAELRERARFDVVSGTSVGAINSAALAACADAPILGIRKLADTWRSLSLGELIPLSIADLLSVPAWFLGRQRREALFPAGPIEALVKKSIDWERIHVNLAAGHLNAFSVSCTHVPSGKTVVFYETRDGRPRSWSRDPHVRAVHTRIEPDHARASAAIPFLFPPVAIDGIPYVDGGLRQNTPLSPALRLGSTRILVVGMGAEKVEPTVTRQRLKEWNEAVGRPIFLLGKVLNALMLDRVEYDLIHLEHFNLILRDGEHAFGQEFVERLNRIIGPVRGARYRVVPHLAIRPSRDLGRLAAEHVRSGALGADRSITSRMVRLLARAEPREEADLTSYVMFDGTFVDKLINLGIEDAHAQREALLRFFSAPTDN
jgi:NTE family protein